MMHQEKEKRAQKPYCSPKGLNVKLLLLAAPTVVLLLLLTLCTLFSAQRYTSLLAAARVPRQREHHRIDVRCARRHHGTGAAGPGRRSH